MGSLVTEDRDSVRETVRRVWSETLRTTVHDDDDFFDLGGDSLDVTEVVARLEDVLKVRIPLGLLFDAPTLAEFTTGVDALAAHRS